MTIKAKEYFDSNHKLELVPMTFAEANAFVIEHHQHHPPVRQVKFSIGCAVDGKIVGVALVGRPVARFLDNGWTLEVNRSCTDGTKNANSFLYGAAWRAAKALGFKKLITYTLPSESSVTLKAAGWTLIGEAGGGTWNRKSRPRVDLHPLQKKLKWEKSV